MLWTVRQTGHLSPALALRCVELQAQQAGSDHAEPVDVHHILGILAFMAKNTATEEKAGSSTGII